MKLNIISEVITTDNANLLPMLKNKELMLVTMAVVTGGFGRRAPIRVAQRASMQAASSICMAALSTMITTLFGPLYG